MNSVVGPYLVIVLLAIESIVEFLYNALGFISDWCTSD